MSNESLRSLVNTIAFEIDDALLKKADLLMDDFRDKVVDSGESIAGLGQEAQQAAEAIAVEFGEAGQAVREMTETAQAGLEGAGKAASDTKDGLRDVGAEAERAGRQAQTAFRGMEGGLDSVNAKATELMGILQGGIAGAAGAGFLGMITGLSMGTESAMVRMKFDVREGTAEWNKLLDAVAETERFTKGFFGSGELMAAVNEGLSAGLDPNLIADHLKEMAVVAAARGKDLNQVVNHFGNTISRGAVASLRSLGLASDEELAAMGVGISGTISHMDQATRSLWVMGLAQEWVNDRIDTFNEFTETGTAKTKSWRNALSDMAEVMGDSLFGSLKAVLTTTTSWFREMNNSTIGRAILQFSAWGITAVTVATGLGAVGKAASFAKAQFLPLLVPMAKAALIAAGIVLILDDLWTAFEGGESVIEPAFNAFMDFLGLDYRFSDLRSDALLLFDDMREAGGALWEWTKAQWGEGEGWLAYAARGYAKLWASSWKTLANLTKMGLGLVTGVLTGEWRMWDEGLAGLIESFRDRMDAVKTIFHKPLEWANQKLVDWRDGVQAKIDSVVDGFLGIPDQVIGGIQTFGNQLQDEFKSTLQRIRNMLPFSPPKEGPLVDIYEAGGNIIGQIREGIMDAGPLGLEAVTRVLDNGMSAIQQRFTPSAAPPVAVAGAGIGGGGFGNASFRFGDIVINTQSKDPRGVAQEVEKVLREKLGSEMERFFGRLRIKRPRTTDR